jgi:glyoxylase-like metal-dependent hydrolase (beta-lactamase superfamily II)
MCQWTIDVLFYGKVRGPGDFIIADSGLGEQEFDVPYLGFLLRSGDQKVLVDNGMREDFIIDGKAWGGFPAVGGKTFVSDSLSKHGLLPGDIQTVIYTHLHNDHAGNCDLFPGAKHIFQKDEWKNLCAPIPAQKIRRDFDTSVIPLFEKLDTTMIDGDIEIFPGINVYKAPGHSLGSQLVTVKTANGIKVILGDLCNTYSHIFPECPEFTDLEGNVHKIKTNVEKYGPAIPSPMIYDYFAFYDSVYKAKVLAQWKIENVLPGHETALVKDFHK